MKFLFLLFLVLGLLATTTLLVLKLAGLGDTANLSLWTVFAPGMIGVAFCIIPALYHAHQYAMEPIRHQRRLEKDKALREELAKARLLR